MPMKFVTKVKSRINAASLQTGELYRQSKRGGIVFIMTEGGCGVNLATGQNYYPLDTDNVGIQYVKLNAELTYETTGEDE